MFDKLGKRFIENRVNVGVADIKICEAPDLLVTHLGSCIAVTVYDKQKKKGGMLHALLPRNNCNSSIPEKYCDSGLEKLIASFETSGKLNPARYEVKVFGGATILAVALNDVGKENATVIKSILEQKNIRPDAYEVGGRKGYEVILDCEDGKTYVRRFGEEFREV
ncbi:MAG: chemotaxis protein CheD [Oligoflexia bacterium]|nr:chemotaxis protein CheD [Oligoflexia bacterium]